MICFRRKERKIWWRKSIQRKVFQSIFSSDNDDDENKRKVDEKFIVNCGACWGVMWDASRKFGLKVSSVDVENSLDLFKNFINAVRLIKTVVDLWHFSIDFSSLPTFLKNIPDDENVTIAKQKNCCETSGWIQRSKIAWNSREKFFPIYFSIAKRIFQSRRERMELPALETWIITTLRALVIFTCRLKSASEELFERKTFHSDSTSRKLFSALWLLFCSALKCTLLLPVRANIPRK